MRQHHEEKYLEKGPKTPKAFATILQAITDTLSLRDTPLEAITDIQTLVKAQGGLPVVSKSRELAEPVLASLAAVIDLHETSKGKMPDPITNMRRMALALDMKEQLETALDMDPSLSHSLKIFRSGEPQFRAKSMHPHEAHASPRPSGKKTHLRIFTPEEDAKKTR
jgi:hypothetical protein